MAYYIIKWNTGYGESVELLDCESQEEAQECAYANWREEVENQADYSAVEYSDDEAGLCDLVEEAIDLGIYKGDEK